MWNATYPRILTEEVSGSEDCLYLNVYRTDLTTQKRLLPVMVFPHGGGFSSGSSYPGIYGNEYCMGTRGVVMVTIQYRLGVFGFLAANDKSCKAEGPKFGAALDLKEHWGFWRRPSASDHDRG